MERRGWEIDGREEDGVMWKGGTWLREYWGAKKCDGNGWCGMGGGGAQGEVHDGVRGGSAGRDVEWSGVEWSAGRDVECCAGWETEWKTMRC